MHNVLPTPAERERLQKLIEECAEAQKEACKILAHGWSAEFEGLVYDNRGALEREVGDIQAITQKMVACGDLDGRKVTAARKAKFPELTRYMRYQGVSPP
jgi:hypothetical protein